MTRLKPKKKKGVIERGVEGERERERERERVETYGDMCDLVVMDYFE